MKDRPSLAECRKNVPSLLRQATLCFLIRENEVLLAMKKRGFAEGKWNGVGGKKDESDNNIKEAATRETQEEIGVTPSNLQLVATLNFYHIGKGKDGQQVTVYISDKWRGEPTETEEMAPKWFETNEIPYDEMWEDDRHWLPMILAGEVIEGDFLFDDNQNLLEHDIRKVEGSNKGVKNTANKKREVAL